MVLACSKRGSTALAMAMLSCTHSSFKQHANIGFITYYIYSQTVLHTLHKILFMVIPLLFLFLPYL